MSEHPILSKQFSKVLKGLFKRSAKRGSGVRVRKLASSSKIQTVQQASFSDSQSPHPLSTTQQQVTPNHLRKKKGPKSGGAPDKVSQDKTPKKTSKLGKFWTDLFLVRPWLLVGGLWITSVFMIVLSLEGLSDPGPEMVLEPVSTSITGQPLSGPDVAAASRLATRDDLAQKSRRDPAATLPGSPEQAMPIWPLLFMVLACAGGCMLMSKQGVLTTDNTSRRGRRRVPADKAPTPRPVVQSTGQSRSRRSKKRRRLNAQRPASQVMAFRTNQQNLSHTSPHQNPMVSKPISFAVNSEPTTQVTVIPDNETSPLDWKEGSLAHKLDVRQTRSLNSFL